MNTRVFREQADYWDQKLANYLHDPPDKALHIPGHEDRAKALRDLLRVPSPDDTRCQRADWIASGMDRTLLPGYDQDISRSGAVDFLKSPFLTHPTGASKGLNIEIESDINYVGIFQKIREMVKSDAESLATRFEGKRELLTPARFHYIHHALRKRLADENVGSLGGLWYRLPADTRIPDHSIWQHCGLTSALCSCFETSGQAGASLLVFSIGPVQQFINRARKLRDFWTSSLILSWLAFEGLCFIISEFGSDHILYPSVIHQPLVDQLLADELGLEWLSRGRGNTAAGVASLPNKFVCLVPKGSEADVASGIEQCIRDAWLDLGNKTCETIEETLGKADSYVSEQFRRQLSHFWNFRWAACPLVDEKGIKTAKALLYKEIWTRAEHFLEASKELFQSGAQQVTEGPCYGVTHALVQAFLAAGKIRRENQREDEPGIKCSLNSEFEALHFEWKEGDDRNPRARDDPFWNELKSKWDRRTDFKPSERLSAPATLVRLAYQVCKGPKEDRHPLRDFFENAEEFPSTTEMALRDWLDAVQEEVIRSDLFKQAPDWSNASKKLAQVVHGLEPDSDERQGAHEITDLPAEEERRWQDLYRRLISKNPVKDEDKYYAILLMDGDHMGRLVSGESLASTWASIIHPDLVDRLTQKGFRKSFVGFWTGELRRTRLLSPGVHAAISEALADLSIETVPRIVERNKGKLIYAGGDDVCAVLPVSTAISAAREIARRYSYGFCFLRSGEDNEPTEIGDSWVPEPGRLIVHLGKGERISVSSAVLICHHKKPLSVAMTQAHSLLKRYAKAYGGRNALAVELDKRGGGVRRFVAQWDEEPTDLCTTH
ncbi:MAG: type III-B CRISPR-associated protein Cas10/Cmr2, partial [Deltaproteobacteria bacterium]|nr:type III-B CRISPR-associated protein Cas10/Cmr2 [Deltaproteobacteria bacterium]